MPPERHHGLMQRSGQATITRFRNVSVIQDLLDEPDVSSLTDEQAAVYQRVMSGSGAFVTGNAGAVSTNLVYKEH